MKKNFLTCFSILMVVTGLAQTGSISNIQVTQRSDGSGLVDVYFNLNGPGNNYHISIEASFNAGGSYTSIDPVYISGDVWTTSPGNNKHIVWNGMQNYPNIYSSQTRLKLLAISYPTSISDIDGNVYQTVPIGQQLWMKENLKTTHYRNGVSIEYPGSNNTIWQNNTSGCYAWYNNDITLKNAYGALYNWYTVNNANGLCPSGWHVPNDSEWDQLINFTSGGETSGGNQLKSCRQVNSPLGGVCNTTDHPRWEFYNSFIYGTDDYGWSAFPGGYRNQNGYYDYLTKRGCWWSGTVHNSTLAAYLFIYYHYPTAAHGSAYNKQMGYSVRCVMD